MAKSLSSTATGLPADHCLRSGVCALAAAIDPQPACRIYCCATLAAGGKINYGLAEIAAGRPIADRMWLPDGRLRPTMHAG